MQKAAPGAGSGLLFCKAAILPKFLAHFCGKRLAKLWRGCYNTKALELPGHRQDNDTSLYRRSSAENSGMNVDTKWRNS